jgi:hypothetical protein
MGRFDGEEDSESGDGQTDLSLDCCLAFPFQWRLAEYQKFTRPVSPSSCFHIQ